MRKLFSIPPLNKTADKNFVKIKSSDDMTNSDVLVRKKQVGFKNFSFCSNFSFSLFFKLILRNLAEFYSVAVSCL